MDKIIPYSSKRVGWPEWPEWPKCLNCFRRRSPFKDQLLSPGSSQDDTDTPGKANKGSPRPESAGSSPMTSPITSPTGKTKEELLKDATTIIESLVSSEDRRKALLDLFKNPKTVLTLKMVKTKYIPYTSFKKDTKENTKIVRLINLHTDYHTSPI
jgi:hypothetical protein